MILSYYITYYCYDGFKYDTSINDIYNLSVGAFILGLVSVGLFSAGKELPDTYSYQIIVDDSVPISVFTENYEIKSQEGITYWVVEKEKG